jgi:hypothetical protein
MLVAAAKKNGKKAENVLGRCGASSGQIKNLSNLYSVEIYGFIRGGFVEHLS